MYDFYVQKPDLSKKSLDSSFQLYSHLFTFSYEDEVSNLKHVFDYIRIHIQVTHVERPKLFPLLPNFFTLTLTLNDSRLHFLSCVVL